jgi:hypothetical protein
MPKYVAIVLYVTNICSPCLWVPVVTPLGVLRPRLKEWPPDIDSSCKRVE